MPPIPKPASTRARRNKSAGARTLRAVEDAVVPDLPIIDEDDETGGWHPLTVDWWEDIWSSPMAPEFDSSDSWGLVQLAMLVDQFWADPKSSLLAEIRLQRQCFGLTPIDRRRLQWEIDRGAEADERNQQRENKRVVDTVKRPEAGAGKPVWVKYAVDVCELDAAKVAKLTKKKIIELVDEPTEDPRQALA